MDHPLHHPLHLRQQTFLLAFTAVQRTGLGHGVEQATGRVVMLGEQRLVLQRHLQVGRMQVGEGGLAGVRQAVVVEDEVEQHADQVDHVRFLLGHLLLAWLRAMAFQLLVQVRLQALDPLGLLQARGQVVGRLLLQAIERLQQVGRAVGPCCALRGIADDAGCAGEGDPGFLVEPAMLLQQCRQAAVQRTRLLGRRCRKIGRRRGRAGGGGRGGILAWSRLAGLRLGRGGLALRGVLEVGQHAGIDEALVEPVVQTIQPLHYLLVEEHIKDCLDAQGEGHVLQRIAERLGDDLGAEGVAVLTELATVVEQRQALVQRKEWLGATRLDPADHVGDQQALFVDLVLDQLQVVGVQLGDLRLGLAALHEVTELLGDALVIEAFDLRSLSTDLAHAVEEQRLHLIVLGFFRAFEEGVVDLGEDAGQVLGKVVHHQLATAQHEIAEARLDTSVGQRGDRAGRRRCILAAHGPCRLGLAAGASCVVSDEAQI